MAAQDSPNRQDQDELLRVAALMAHQLKTPISAAGSLLNAVLGEYTGPLTAQQRRMLERMDKCIGESLDAMRRMLDIVSPANEEELLRAASDVTAALQSAKLHFGQALKARSIALDIADTAAPVYARIQNSAMIEMVNALLGNAIKYTPDNGRIEVSVDAEPDAQSLRMVVSDSGIGIPAENREKIFQPFFRTNAARSSDRPGVGLGLAFVSSVVRKAGGDVSADKSHLGGARFVVTLPVATGKALAELQDQIDHRFRVVIVGGVAAGPKAAAKIIRLNPDADVTIVEKGRFLSYAGCGLPYYVSGGVSGHRELMCTPAGALRDPVFFQQVKNVHVKSSTEAVEIDRLVKRVRIRDGVSGDESWVPYDKLLLATGASPIIPPIPGIDKGGVFTLHGVQDAEGIKAELASGRARDVVIVGGGLVGMEMTEALVDRGCRVTIIELGKQIMRMLDWEMARMLERHLESKGVKVLTDTRAQAIEGSARDPEQVASVSTNHGVFRADMVILAVGVRPNVDLARRAGLEISEETGAIKVDDHLCTADPDIYAAGDCVECQHIVTGRACYVPLGSTANKQGRIAATNICGGDYAFPGVCGSTVCKVFDYTVARTGLAEVEAREIGYDVITVLAPAPDKAHYLPTAKWLYLKLVVERGSGRLLGTQSVGPGDGAKRIDVASMAIAAGMTLREVANADLCYAPPYAPVMDNLITAANIGLNKLSGDMVGITPVDVHERLECGQELVLLDVRTTEEYEQERLPGSVLIPLATLRGRLQELPRDKPIVAFCNISLRGYEAALILRAAGFTDVKVMDGGLAMWPYEKE